MLPPNYMVNQKHDSYPEASSSLLYPNLLSTSSAAPQQLIESEGEPRSDAVFVLDIDPVMVEVNSSSQHHHHSLSLTLGSQQQLHPGCCLSPFLGSEYASPSSLFCNSKYVKAAQDLLDEIVCVQGEFKRSAKMNSVVAGDLDANIDGDSGDGVSPSERRDLREKVAKLSAMLGEVERRYRLYCDQMQDLVSSFDMSAGRGASSRYTSVAFRTISRQFRRLQNAIRKEMESCRRRLGERDDDKSSSSAVVLSRLRHVDRHFYQQQQQQQKGYRIEQTWRPQRGLPETAVSILRAWLFEHFLHPYPKDSEKLVLARQTGLSRSQVANWFINARVRLWKPMIEEMYREEFSEEDEFGSKEPNSASGFRQDDEDDSNATAKNNDTTTENVSLELGLQKTTTASISSISEAYYADAHLLSTDYVT